MATLAVLGEHNGSAFLLVLVCVADASKGERVKSNYALQCDVSAFGGAAPELGR